MYAPYFIILLNLDAFESNNNNFIVRKEKTITIYLVVSIVYQI
jgi:hypothetical protein